MFKKVTDQNVKDVFESLIEENGTTTTVDVKSTLRKKGFWVFQSTVSEIMDRIYKDLGFDRTNNGLYYTYFKPLATSDDENEDNDDNDEDDDDDDNATLDDSSVQKSPKSVKSTVISMYSDTTRNAYVITLKHEGNHFTVNISLDSKFQSLTPIYEVKTPENSWYLFCTNEDLITRHKAIYYVWKAINEFEDKSILYSELRSKKII